MKKRYALVLAAAALALGYGINNAAMSDMAAPNIAYVDVASVVSSSAQVQALKKENETKTKELEKWIKTVQADVEKQKTQEAKEKLIKKYNADFEKKKVDLAKNYQEKLQLIDKSISDSIAQQARLNGYDIVLSKGVVLYGGDDLTESVKKVVK